MPGVFCETWQPSWVVLSQNLLMMQDMPKSSARTLHLLLGGQFTPKKHIKQRLAYLGRISEA